MASHPSLYGRLGSELCSNDGSDPRTVIHWCHGHRRVRQKDGDPNSEHQQRPPPTDEDIQRLITEELEDYQRSRAATAKRGLEQSTPVPGVEPFYSPRDIDAPASAKYSPSPTENSSLDHIQICNVISMSVDHPDLLGVWCNERPMDKAPALAPLKDPKYEDISEDSRSPQCPQEPDYERLSDDDNPQMMALCESYGQALSPGCDDGRDSVSRVSDNEESDDDSFVVLLSVLDLQFEPSDGDQNVPANTVADGDCEAEDGGGASSTTRLGVAAASESIQLFDTVVDFLESKAAVDRVQDLSEWMSPRRERESCSSDTEDSCDYGSDLRYNNLTVSQHLRKKKTDPPPPENEAGLVQGGGRGGSGKPSWTLRLRELIEEKASTKHDQSKNKKEKTSKPQNIVIICSDTEGDSEHSYSGGAEWPRSRSSLRPLPALSDTLSQEVTSSRDVLEESIIISDSDTVTVDSMDESEPVSPRSEGNDHTQTAHSLETSLSSPEPHDSLAKTKVTSPRSPGTENRRLLSKPDDATRHVHVNTNGQKHFKDSDPAVQRKPVPQSVSSSQKPKTPVQLYGEWTDAEESSLVAPTLIPPRGQDSLQPSTVIRGENGITTTESDPKRFSREISPARVSDQFSGSRSPPRGPSPPRETITEPSSSKTSESHLFSSKRRISHFYPASSRHTKTEDKTHNAPRKASVREPLKRDWENSYYPTRRDKRHWTATKDTAGSRNKGPKTNTTPATSSHDEDRTRRDKVSPNQERPHDQDHTHHRRRKRRPNSKHSDTILMKRSKMEALEWRKATNRSSARNTSLFLFKS